jgi:hypothetical protein
MATSKAKLEVGQTYKVKGETSKLANRRGSWYIFENGMKARAKDVKPAGKAKGNGAAKGERVFTVHNEEGEVERSAVFKLDHYVKHNDESTEGGFKPLDINDDVAGMLRGLGVEEQFEEAARVVRQYRDDKWKGTKTEIEQEFRNRYEKLNPGQIRMNLGNIIRGCARRAEKAEEEAAA